MYHIISNSSNSSKLDLDKNYHQLWFQPAIVCDYAVMYAICAICAMCVTCDMCAMCAICAMCVICAMWLCAYVCYVTS